MTIEELLAEYARGVLNFSGCDFSEANLSGIKLSGANLSKTNLSVVNLSGANLSDADLSYAKLNVARLSGANLAGAKLHKSNLNVANLIRADLSRTQLQGASLIRAELIRADLTRANLSEANLSSSDLREATLRQANLRHANLSEANLRGCLLTGANLEMANLNCTFMNSADLSGANLRDSEIKQANLSLANLSGADLSGANLRWADLSGANLRWADLSGAKLSGANLTGADLSNANLTNASLVHTNLTQAKLIQVEWIGADLSGAMLTGAKLYATSRFGLKTENIHCEWVDLSPAGDRSIIQKFDSEHSREFFNAAPPTIRIVIDAPLEQEGNFALAGAYYQIAQEFPLLKYAPSIDTSSRRTIFSWRVDSDLNLLPTAYMAILPFHDAAITHKNISAIWEIITKQILSEDDTKSTQILKQLIPLIEEVTRKAANLKQIKKNIYLAGKLNFTKTPTQTILTNSAAHTLMVYDNPSFGKKFRNPSSLNTKINDNAYNENENFMMPSLNMLMEFIKGFHDISQ